MIWFSLLRTHSIENTFTFIENTGPPAMVFLAKNALQFRIMIIEKTFYREHILYVFLAKNALQFRVNIIENTSYRAVTSSQRLY